MVRTNGTVSLLLAASALMAVGGNLVYVQAAEPSDTVPDRVIAIDVLIEPSAAMVEKAQAADARLRGDYPAGYTLGVEHAPDITLVHRYVHEKDLKAVGDAVAAVALNMQPQKWDLAATGCTYAIWGGVAITTIGVERTPELARLHAAIVKAVEPFVVAKGAADAFSTTRELPKIEPEIVSYVEKFVPNSSGDKYNPHVTVGVAHEDFVKHMKAEPFEKFSFKAADVAIYQLGSYGTAQKEAVEVERRQAVGEVTFLAPRRSLKRRPQLAPGQ